MFLLVSLLFGADRELEDSSSPARPEARMPSIPVPLPLAARLCTYVSQLAGEIGERNVWWPRALHATAMIHARAAIEPALGKAAEGESYA
jgi:hypothetical protein